MWGYTKLILILVIIDTINCNSNDIKVLEKLSTKCLQQSDFESCLEKRALEGLMTNDHHEFAPGFSVDRVKSDQGKQLTGDEDPGDYILSRVQDYLKSHVFNINLGTALQGWQSQIGFHQERSLNSRTGSNTFLTGFGLGFLAFALKKLLLPVFIGAQVVKSILLAMFLPTLLSGIGKFLGKSGATVFGASSGPSDDFDFKDNYDPTSSSYDTAASTNTATFTYPSQQSPQNRFESSLDTSYTNPANYYQSEKLGVSQYSLQNMYKNRRPAAGATLRPSSTLDFKQFNNIPSSSLMLSNYDPFYSPLLSRLDSIFKQMGYDQGDEACREKAVCYMYRTPAKYVPYSNLVSAQLSRELNELQKPSANNPGVLRFFRYMKAAKDGQDHNDCDQLYTTCRAPELQPGGGKSSDTGILGANPPMVKTYNEINKLVQARRLAKQLA